MYSVSPTRAQSPAPTSIVLPARVWVEFRYLFARVGIELCPERKHLLGARRRRTLNRASRGRLSRGHGSGSCPSWARPRLGSRPPRPTCYRRLPWSLCTLPVVIARGRRVARRGGRRSRRPCRRGLRLHVIRGLYARTRHPSFVTIRLAVCPTRSVDLCHGKNLRQKRSRQSNARGARGRAGGGGSKYVPGPWSLLAHLSRPRLVPHPAHAPQKPSFVRVALLRERTPGLLSGLIFTPDLMSDGMRDASSRERPEKIIFRHRAVAREPPQRQRPSKAARAHPFGDVSAVRFAHNGLFAGRTIVPGRVRHEGHLTGRFGRGDFGKRRRAPGRYAPPRRLLRATRGVLSRAC